ncbi:uncharacterized protein LOC134813509 [Bolinopsis microptera]|uniref:uncharacterized protein LOC134811701 n=1 Tax=Bolinopsis microptera TaxID=2820187 RepID=UPI00307A332E
MKKALSAWILFSPSTESHRKEFCFSQSGVNRLIKKIKSLIKEFRTPAGKRLLNENQAVEATLIRPVAVDTRWNSYYMIFQAFQNKKYAITITAQNAELSLSASQQMTPHDWDLLTKAIAVLKPFYITTKAAEGDMVSVSEVIPNIKKLDYAIRSISSSGVGTLKPTLLSEM